MPSVVKCGEKVKISWPAITEGCKATIDDFEGIEYFPSIVLSVDKRLADGSIITVSANEIISRCNTDGKDGTMNEIEWKVPTKLDGLWNKQGGSDNEDKRLFKLTAAFLTPQSTKFTAVDFEFDEACTFEASTATKVCTSNCFGPTADCKDGTCKCKGQYKLMDGICALEGEIVVKPPMIDPDQDCQYSPWTEFTGCTSPCGKGTRTRRRRIVEVEKGNGKKCEVMNCPEDPLDNCIEQTIECNGRFFNPECPPEDETTKEENKPKEGCFGCACRNADPRCDDELECAAEAVTVDGSKGTCVTKQEKLGCADCGCRTVGKKCDDALQCTLDNKCKPAPKGCAGCSCNNGSCDKGLTCNASDLCARPPRPQCRPGSERCKCDNGGCELETLECSDNVCQAKGVVAIPTNPAKDTCSKLSSCTDCRNSLDEQGVACAWCNFNTGSRTAGWCTFAAVLTCPDGYSLQNVLNPCADAPVPTAAPTEEVTIYTQTAASLWTVGSAMLLLSMLGVTTLM